MQLETLQYFTTLQKLEVLKLHNSVASGVDHVTTGLLPKLPSLWKLDLHCEGLTSLQQLSGLSKLTHLHDLTLQGWDMSVTMEDADLQLLQPLKELTKLECGLLKQCTEEALDGFRKSMPRLKTLFKWSMSDLR